MDVIRAQSMGLCFGVRDALSVTSELTNSQDITIFGELVHNEKINQGLISRGFRQLSEHEREITVPETAAVLVTAHGISDAERTRLEAAGKQIIDTTCPLVRRAHEAGLRLEADGYFVLVIGRRGHVEVQGLTGDLRNYEVVQAPSEVRCYDAAHIGIICQTTTTESLAQVVLGAIRAKNPGKDIRFVDTVCRPTRERQDALQQLLPQVDALVVVGGRHSRNTRELAESARSRGTRTWHVESADDLDPAWFEGVEKVGLTAGTSTLDETIEEVYEALLKVPASGFQVPSSDTANPELGT